MIRKLVYGLTAFVLGATLVACNTMSGVGKDVEKAGEAIQGAAKK